MTNLFGSLLGGMTYDPPRVIRFERYTDEEMAHMSAGGSLHSSGHTWKDSYGGECSIQTGRYFTKEECDVELARFLMDMKYTRPKWWEYWRWGERKLSAEVEKLFDAALAEKEPE